MMISQLCSYQIEQGKLRVVLSHISKSRCGAPIVRAELMWGFSAAAFCVMLAFMGNKDKGKREAKKAPKPKPKPEPSQKREIFTPPPPK